MRRVSVVSEPPRQGWRLWRRACDDGNSSSTSRSTLPEELCTLNRRAAPSGTVDSVSVASTARPRHVPLQCAAAHYAMSVGHGAGRLETHRSTTVGCMQYDNVRQTVNRRCFQYLRHDSSSPHLQLMHEAAAAASAAAAEAASAASAVQASPLASRRSSQWRRRWRSLAPHRRGDVAKRPPDAPTP